MNRLFLAWLCAIATPCVVLAAPESLNLSDAIEKALTSSPRLKSAASAVAASEGSQVQAGLTYNPEIAIEGENFSGRNQYGGFDSLQSTLDISQVLEVGGKISGRLAVAQEELALAQLGQNLERLNVIHDTTTAYANAVTAQKLLKLTSEQKALADDLYGEVRERVAAAREPLIQRSKAEITLSTAQFAQERAERELNHAKHVLATLWGEHKNNFDLDGKEFFILTPPLKEEDVEEKLEESPALQRYLVSQDKTKAQYELEKAMGVPDPRLHIGFRDYRDTSDQALVAGVSFPLPVFNRNQGNVTRAREEMNKAETDKQTARLSMVSKAHESLEAQINAYRQAESLKTAVLPAAEKAFSLSRQGYSAGKLPYLEVLDAQRTLFEVKEQYITTLKEYHFAKADVERLTAQHAEGTKKEKPHAE